MFAQTRGTTHLDWAWARSHTQVGNRTDVGSDLDSHRAFPTNTIVWSKLTSWTKYHCAKYRSQSMASCDRSCSVWTTCWRWRPENPAETGVGSKTSLREYVVRSQLIYPQCGWYPARRLEKIVSHSSRWGRNDSGLTLRWFSQSQKLYWRLACALETLENIPKSYVIYIRVNLF